MMSLSNFAFHNTLPSKSNAYKKSWDAKYKLLSFPIKIPEVTSKSQNFCSVPSKIS